VATKYYVLDLAPAFTPATIRGAWDQTASAVGKALSQRPEGTQATVTIAETNADPTWDVLLGRFVGPPLAAQTVGGTLDVLLPVAESAAAADLYFHVHAYVTVGDTDVVRGTLLNDWVQAAGANEWAYGYGYQFYGRTLGGAQALTDVVCQAGDRIVLEVGYVARNSVATSYSGSLVYGAPSTVPDLNGTSDYYDNFGQKRRGYVTFSANLVEYGDGVDLRATQQPLEVFSGGAGADVRIPQEVLEVFSQVEPPTDVRVTHGLLEVVSADQANDVRVTQQVVEVFSRNVVDPCAAPLEGEDLSAAQEPLLWAEWDPGDGGGVRAYAETDHNDDLDYYFGYKPPRLLAISDIRRAAAGAAWDYEVGRFDVLLEDSPRDVRGILASANGRYWPGKHLRVRMVSDPGRRAKVTPYLCAYGTVEGNPAFNGLTVSLAGRDWIGAAKQGGQNSEILLPKQRISGRVFADVPAAVRGLGVPIGYGKMAVPAPMTAPTVTTVPGGTLAVGRAYYVCVVPVVDGVEMFASAAVSCQPLAQSIGPPNFHETHLLAGGTLGRYFYTKMTALIAGAESPTSNLQTAPADSSPNTVAQLVAGAPVTPGITHARGYLFNARNANGVFDPHTNPTDLVPLVPGDPLIVRYKDVPATGGAVPPAPTNIDIEIVGTPGTTHYVYEITQANTHGESAPLRGEIFNGPDVLDENNWLDVEWSGNSELYSQVIRGRSDGEINAGEWLDVNCPWNSIGCRFRDKGDLSSKSWAIPLDEIVLPAVLFESEADGFDWLGGGQSVQATWAGYPDADSYNVYFADSPTDASFVRVKNVFGLSTTFTSVADGSDAGLSGLPAAPPITEYCGYLKLIPVGTEMIAGVQWQRLLAFGHAVTSIDHWYYKEGSNPVEVDLGEGTDFLVPGRAGWNAYFPVKYRDLVGTDGLTRRYTLLYAKGTKGDALAAGTASLSIDAHGVEDIGNGTGECILDLYQQAKHFLNHFFLPSGEAYLSGNWPTPPMFPDTSICRVNSTSFCALTALRRAQLPPNGYLGGGVIGAGGELVAGGAILTRWMQSGEFRFAQNRFWQISAIGLDEATARASLPRVGDVNDVHKDGFVPSPRLEEMFNAVPLQYAPVYGASGLAWMGSETLRNGLSITNYQREVASPTLTLYYVPWPGVARHVGQRYLARSKQIPVYVALEGDLSLLKQFDNGSYFTLDHYEGIGANGYEARPLWVLGVTLRPEFRRVQLECLDVGDLIA
jgi:hypothetical protein